MCEACEVLLLLIALVSVLAVGFALGYAVCEARRESK